jgi:hypothetical protein
MGEGGNGVTREVEIVVATPAGRPTIPRRSSTPSRRRAPSLPIFWRSSTGAGTRPSTSAGGGRPRRELVGVSPQPP